MQSAVTWPVRWLQKLLNRWSLRSLERHGLHAAILFPQPLVKSAKPGWPNQSFGLIITHVTSSSHLLHPHHFQIIPFKEWPVPFHTEEKPQGSECITLGQREDT